MVIEESTSLSEGKEAMDSIEITIDAGINDARRIILWRLFRSKLYWLYCGAAVIGTTVLLKDDPWGEIYISVFLMVLPVSAALGIAQHVWKRVKGLKRSIRFEPEGIRSISDYVEVLHRWEETMIITETKRYLFATVGKRPVFILCKYRLDQATIDNVRAFVSQRISEVSGN